MPRGVRLSNEQKELIKEKTRGCLTRQEIADLVGVDVKTITKWQQKLGVTPACHRTLNGGKILIQAPPEFPETEEAKPNEKKPEDSEFLVVTDKTLTITGVGTGFVYHIALKSDEIYVEMYNELIKIDVKDIVHMTKELNEIALKLNRMSKDAWSE